MFELRELRLKGYDDFDLIGHMSTFVLLGTNPQRNLTNQNFRTFEKSTNNISRYTSNIFQQISGPCNRRQKGIPKKRRWVWEL